MRQQAAEAELIERQRKAAAKLFEHKKQLKLENGRSWQIAQLQRLKLLYWIMQAEAEAICLNWS